MSISATVTRTFERAEGAESLVRDVELAIAPFPGLHVDYGDGTGEGMVAHVWIRLRGWSPGLHPPAVTVRMIPEPAEALESARPVIVEQR